MAVEIKEVKGHEERRSGSLFAAAVPGQPLTAAQHLQHSQHLQHLQHLQQTTMRNCCAKST
jgi:hypothetical protein